MGTSGGDTRLNSRIVTSIATTTHAPRPAPTSSTEVRLRFGIGAEAGAWAGLLQGGSVSDASGLYLAAFVGDDHDGHPVGDLSFEVGQERLHRGQVTRRADLDVEGP